MVKPRWFRCYLGAQARRALNVGSWSPDRFSMLLAASGGPRWLGLVGLDRALARFLGSRNPEAGRLPMLGASSGAWRVAALACDDTLETYEELIEAYLTQSYFGRPKPAEVSQVCQEYLGRVFTPERVRHLLDHPRLETRFTTAVVPKTSHSGLSLLIRLFSALLLNAADRRLLGRAFERTLFVAGHGAAPEPSRLLWDALPTRIAALDETNFLCALLASGSIPTVLAGVSDIPGTGAGHHFDGGLLDYHFELEQTGPILYPHFSEDLVPGWLDRFPPGRRLSRAARSQLCLILPSHEMLASFPEGSYPVRQDFERWENPVRIENWRKTVAASARCESELLCALESGDLLRLADPLP